MKLSDFNLGKADSLKEYMLTPEIFELAFFDPRQIELKLLNDWNYILLGRKGVGKSAYNVRIQYLSKKEQNIMATPLMLDEFEYTIFAKVDSSKDIKGTKKYYDAWNFLLLFQIYKFLYENVKNIEDKSFVEIIEMLKHMGFSINNSFQMTVKAMSKLKTGINIGVFDIQFEQEFGCKPDNFMERISTVVNKMFEVLYNINIPKKVYVLIDGVDDILRIKKNQIEILSSLLRSIEKLNKEFYKNHTNAKILIFLREDIFNKISDPDLNKIKLDGYIPLSWGDNIENLKKIAELRLNMNNHNNEPIIWENLFVEEGDKSSWDVVAEHTLYKPRDILQFLVTCQNQFPDKEKLLSSEVRKALKIYSRDYFIGEMKNELSGYIEDDIISVVPSLFQRIGSKDFTVNELDNVLKEQIPKNIESLGITKQLLLVLFESGYIGQRLKTNRSASVVFKYRNTGANIDYSQKFLIHKGIQRGLGVNV